MQLGKRRIFQKAMGCEKDHVPDFAPDVIMIRLLGEIFPQALLADVGLDRERILPLSCDGERGHVEVRRENLHFGAYVAPQRLIGEQHGEWSRPPRRWRIREPRCESDRIPHPYRRALGSQFEPRNRRQPDRERMS